MYLPLKWEYLFGHVKRRGEMLTTTESACAEAALQLCDEQGGIPFQEFVQIAGNFGWQLIDFHSTRDSVIPQDDDNDLVVFKRERVDEQ